MAPHRDGHSHGRGGSSGGSRNSAGHGHGHGAKRSGIIPYITWLFVAVSSMVVLGLIFSFLMTPSEFDTVGGPGTNSVLTKQELGSRSDAIKRKILQWLPQQHRHLFGALTSDLDVASSTPDFSQLFWTPIDIDVSSDPMVTLCRLNFKEYSSHPHMYAMFRDFVAASNCVGSNRKRDRLSTLMAELASKNESVGHRFVKPTGFVFHESRVGSTLVANLLASHPWNMVFSESAPTANALLHCQSCSKKESIKLFRDVVTLMGRSPFHKRLFFKFQSITTTKMEIALEAFPATPWIFVYRQPIQTMMSHLDPRKGSTGAPCLRSMRSPPDQVRETLNDHKLGRSPPREAWCAAHLNMLCNRALAAYMKYNTTNYDGKQKQRGYFVNYDALPGVIPQVVLPMFGVAPPSMWLQAMKGEAVHYSKGRKTSRVFFSDSEDKDERATANIQKYSQLILQPTYDILNSYSELALRSLSPSLQKSIFPLGARFDWKLLRPIPTELSGDVKLAVIRSSLSDIVDSDSTFSGAMQDQSGLETIPHSHPVTRRQHHIPWSPFSNGHKSKPFEKSNCLLKPVNGYPREYPILQLLDNWNTDSTEIPDFHYDSLCHFDFQNATELQAAYQYRTAEVPFVVYNMPEVDEVSKKWSDVDYLFKRLGPKVKYRTETSKNNHFMYWRGGAGYLRNRDGSKWSPPTGITSLTFEQWLETAVKGQNISLDERNHKYFRVSSDLGANTWLFDELPFLQPKKSLLLVDPREQRGIHCRFGMRSVIAEAHFDGSRNSVVMLGGLRRWILSHPQNCENMHMLPRGHPSGRHSEVDWSRPNTTTFPKFPKVTANEVILQPGDVLYVPTYWIHYIISLNVNYQCNTRSGASPTYDQMIRKCGF